MEVSQVPQASSELLDTFISTTPIYSYKPVVLAIPGRPVDLQLRVTVPAEGDDLPVLLLSSGQGMSHNLSSLNGYAPLAQIWAAEGFAVIQPTHLSAGALKHVPAVAEAPAAGELFWRSRAEDMIAILDRLDQVEATVPGLAGRLDRESIAIAGHSLGGFTAELLLGTKVTDPDGGEVVDLTEPRITQGVLLTAAGGGGSAINGPMADKVGFWEKIDFSDMWTPALVVAGTQDDPRHFTDRGPAWFTDVYHLSPGPKSLLRVYGGEHLLGGISGFDAKETTDENPTRVAAVALLTAAYLRSQFRQEDDSWQVARETWTTGPDAIGSVESK